ncbi:MAG: hypothetical protein OXT67_14150 [Zetaproteobacteria bacterium]|nr:hypothetical protein [Zetaproteobacteria bacterium]
MKTQCMFRSGFFATGIVWLLLGILACDSETGTDDYNAAPASVAEQPTSSQRQEDAAEQGAEVEQTAAANLADLDLATPQRIHAVSSKLELIQGDVAFLNIIGHYTLERVDVVRSGLEINFEGDPIVRVIESEQGYKIRAEKVGKQKLFVEVAGHRTEMEVEVLDATVQHMILDNSIIMKRVVKIGGAVRPDDFQVRALAVLSDQRVIDVTSQVEWTVQPPGIVTADPLDPSKFRVGSEGDGTVVARYRDFQDSFAVSFKIAEASLAQIFVEDTPVIMDLQSVKNISLLARLSNGVVAPYREEFDIELVGEGETLTVNAEERSLYGQQIGVAQVKITPIKHRDLAFETTVTVTDARLQSMVAEPAALELDLGETQQLKILGRYSDGSERDISSQVKWEKVNSMVVGFDFEYPYELKAIGVGEQAYTFSYQGMTTQVGVRVAEASLESVEVSFDKSFIRYDQTATLSVMGVYSDGSKRDITQEVEYALAGDSASYAVLLQDNGENTHVMKAISMDTAAAHTVEVVVKKQGKEFGKAKTVVSNAKVQSLELVWKKPVAPGSSSVTPVVLDGSQLETPTASLGESICLSGQVVFENDLSTKVDVTTELEWRVDVDSDSNYVYSAFFGTGAKHGCLVSIGSEGLYGPIGLRAIYTDPVSGAKIITSADALFEDKKFATPSVVLHNFEDAACEGTPSASCKVARGHDLKFGALLKYSNGSEQAVVVNPNKSRIEDFEWTISGLSVLRSNGSDGSDVFHSGDQVIAATSLDSNGYLQVRFLQEGTYTLTFRTGSSYYIEDYDDTSLSEPYGKKAATYEVKVVMPCVGGYLNPTNNLCYFYGAMNESCEDVCSASGRELSVNTCAVDTLAICKEVVDNHLTPAGKTDSYYGPTTGSLLTLSGATLSTIQNGCFYSTHSILDETSTWGYRYPGATQVDPSQKFSGIGRVCSCASPVIPSGFKRQEELDFDVAYTCP